MTIVDNRLYSDAGRLIGEFSSHGAAYQALMILNGFEPIGVTAFTEADRELLEQIRCA